MPTNLILHYPVQNTVLFSDTLRVNYKLSSYSDPNVKSVYFELDGVTQTVLVSTESVTFTGLTEGTHTLNGYLLDRRNNPIPNTNFSVSFQTFDSELSVENKLTLVLESTIPGFVREDYPNFVMFLKAYYEWLYSSNNPFYAPLISEDFKDIDKTPEYFVKYFKEQYLKDFPEYLTLDKQTGSPLNLKTLIKNVGEFYSSKGTERSIKFLLKILYDTYSEVYYPRKDLFRSSDSKWNKRKSIKFTGDNVNINDIKQRELVQKIGESITWRSSVVDIQCYHAVNKKIIEIFYQEINGTPNFNYQFQVITENETITLNPLRVVSDITITNSGINYKVNDVIKIQKVYTNQEPVDVSVALVTEVDEYGQIQKIEIANFLTVEDVEGEYYFDITSDIGSGAVLVPVEGYICDYAGFWTQKNSHASSIKVLPDNLKYQELSYVVRTDRSLDKYVVALKKLAHPAGFAVVGDVVLQNQLVEPVEIEDALLDFFTPLIGNYAAYRIFTDVNLRNTEIPIVSSSLTTEGGTDGEFLISAPISPAGQIGTVVRASDHIQLSTNITINNRIALRNEKPIMSGGGAAIVNLSSINIADLSSDVQVTLFNGSGDIQQCLVGFYRAHACPVSSYPSSLGIETLIGFRVNSQNKWRACINVEFETPIEVSTCERYQEVWYVDTDQSIFDRCVLRVMVSDYATKASFYLNNILIGTVTSTQLNLPYLITAYGDGLGGYDPQFTFVGSEIRNRQTESTSIRIYDMKYYQINGTNKTTVDFFPQGFDPNILVPIQTELESRIHFAETPVSDDLTNVKFKHSPIVPDINNKNTYWVVYPHPNTEINNSTDITAFMNIQLKDFLKQEK
jgi:hypothetical protein